MPVLTCHEDESLIVATAGGHIAVSVGLVNGCQDRIGIDAPSSAQIIRQEIADRT